jgi:hypothetical protein
MFQPASTTTSGAHALEGAASRDVASPTGVRLAHFATVLLSAGAPEVRQHPTFIIYFSHY